VPNASAPVFTSSSVGWCFQEEPWIYDAEMEQRLKEQFPFLEVKEEVIPMYKFAGSEVQ
jgi:hypothetical protein